VITLLLFGGLVPIGTTFEFLVAEGHAIGAAARWSRDDRMGAEFAPPLALGQSGREAIAQPRSALRPVAEPPLRKPG
jgi:hypothetical protein